MSLKQQFQLMGDYNGWMNVNLYEAASTFPPAVLSQNHGAFFGSLLGTFNHLMVADTIRLQRFPRHSSRFPSLQSVLDIPTPHALDEILYEDFKILRQARHRMDETILTVVNEANESDYGQVLIYPNTKGQYFNKLFGHLVQYFFNHQTRQRGQLTVLLSQLGIDYDTTDLLVRIADGSQVPT